MRIGRGVKLTNHSPIDNDIKRVFFAEDSGLDYGDFAVYIYIAMHVQWSEYGRNGEPNDKQGYCYKTKVAMCAELSVSRGKLDKAIDKLIEYGFVCTREIPNRYGGKPLLEYRLSTVWRRHIGD